MPDWMLFRDFVTGEDDGPTRFTEDAHVLAREAAERQLTAPQFFLPGPGAQLRVWSPSRPYLTVVVGQFPAEGGMQGLHSERVEELYEVGAPVWMVFGHGTSLWTGFLHALPPARPISKDPMGKRYGWRCRNDAVSSELLKIPAFVFPVEVPEAAPSLF